jgi:hypothetical protein
VSLGWFLLVALLVHLPLTPVGALIGLLALLRASPEEAPPETLNAIPVSLLTPEEMDALGGASQAPPEPAAAPEPAAPAEPAAVPEVPKPKPKPKPKPVDIPDGGVAEGDGSAPVKEKPSPMASAQADGGATEATPKKPSGSDPMALVGKAASVADPNANVKLLLMNDRIRPLAIAGRVGRLVSRLPQWASFFGPTSLDPIRDIERIYVAGPQFRVSADVVAVLEYAVPQATMRAAIDAIVARPPGGEWLDEKIPVARARADRAERIFVLPKGKTLLMVPPHLKDDAVAKASSMRLPAVKGKAAVVAFVSHPWRVLLGLHTPGEIPHSIASVSLSVEPRDDGGAIIHVEATDESEDSAKSNATLLTNAINVLTQRNVGALGSLLFGGETLSLIEPIDLHAQGKKIVGDAQVTKRELERMLAFAEGWLDSIQARNAPQRTPSAPVTPGTATSTPTVPAPGTTP